MSNENKTVVKKQGLSLGSVLTIIFVILKFVGIIDWSWAWVLSPLWIGAGLSLVICLVGLLIIGIKTIIKSKD